MSNSSLPPPRVVRRILAADATARLAATPEQRASAVAGIAGAIGASHRARRGRRWVAAVSVASVVAASLVVEAHRRRHDEAAPMAQSVDRGTSTAEIEHAAPQAIRTRSSAITAADAARRTGAAEGNAP